MGFYRIAPSIGGIADEIALNRNRRVAVTCALRKAELEIANQRNIHAAHEPDMAALRNFGRDEPYQKRSLMVFEQHRLHVGVEWRHQPIDHGEARVGVVFSDIDDRQYIFITDCNDGAGAGIGHFFQRSGWVFAAFNAVLLNMNAQFFLGALGACTCCVDKCAVAIIAFMHVNDGRLLFRRCGFRRGWLRPCGGGYQQQAGQ